MKHAFKLLTLAFLLFASASNAQSEKLKCMIQMSNYPGEGAYIVVSLVNPKGEYEETLYVLGRDKKWYPDLKEWWKFQKVKKQNISAITGASMAGGDRGTQVLEIDKSKIDKGYTLRFEAAVENQKYNVNDIEVPLTTENVSGKVEGSNYIRYVRLAPGKDQN
ncbi:DUF2271 domain-containing protein [Flavobacterium sp.]|uniref:DUF2271 domain-containing protein n=1 Tax=Flavobacterium sp. TaxID=239 RepID=UPI0011FC3FD2|nr:DUF2271 domain-containing protein [Flavobacterium sp.]RZJ73297.1 MAG: DUF2271 domain-containing protein [Flavobacterium sp.]